MKYIRHCLTLAALCLTLPASADEKPNAGTLTLQKAANGTFNFSSEKPQGTLTLTGEKLGKGVVSVSKTGTGSLVLFGATDAETASLARVKITPPVDAEAILLQIDLRVTLQHYEKLKTQLSETHMQRELFESGAPEAPLSVAMARLSAELKAAKTEEEKADAEERSRDFQTLEFAKFEARSEALSKLADNFRARIQDLATEINQRAKDSASSKPQPAAPMPTP